MSPSEPSAAIAEPIKVYFAAPLFSLTERVSNRSLAAAIERHMPGVSVVLPQDFKYHGSFNDTRFFRDVYSACIKGVECARVCIALLDGPSSDDGTSFEVGYAVAKGIPVIGVRTDYRASQEKGCNLMLSKACTEFVHRPSFDEDFDGLARDIVRKIRRILLRAND
jgi:nucleoside 2-deoxyribosyltransferase